MQTFLNASRSCKCNITNQSKKDLAENEMVPHGLAHGNEAGRFDVHVKDKEIIEFSASAPVCGWLFFIISNEDLLKISHRLKQKINREFRWGLRNAYAHRVIPSYYGASHAFWHSG